MADRCSAHPWGTCGRCGRDLRNEGNDLHPAPRGDMSAVEVVRLPTFRPGVRGQMGRWFWIELKGPGQIPTRHGPFKTRKAAEAASTLTWRWGMLYSGGHRRWRRHLFGDDTLVPVCGSATFSYTAEDDAVDLQGERLADCRRCRRRAR